MPDLRPLPTSRRGETSKPPLSAHLVGICGSGMSALASLLLDLGWTITGSDSNPMGSPLRQSSHLPIQIHSGHSAGHLPSNVDVLIHSAAVEADNPERQAARSLRIPELSYSQMLGHLMGSRTGVCVAGTHGKSTTAAMTATILRNAGRDPSACIGAELCESGRGGWAGTSDLFVAESCEYRRSFLDLSPTFAAILGVEPEHFDCFRDFDAVRDAFGQFAARVSPQGVLIARGDCAAAVEAARGSPAKVETFSLNKAQSCDQSHADWFASDLQVTASGTRFRVSYDGRFFAEFHLRVPGRHNVANALAATALCHHLGVRAREMQEAFADFQGVRRRFESVGTWRGVSLFDDYAHHPTAVRLTLQCAREHLRARKLWCVFQPHQISRTRALMAEFAECFSGADESLIAPVYVCREAGGAGESTGRELASRIASSGPRTRFCRDLDRIVATLEDEARPGDVVLTMGAGDIHQVHHGLTRRLQSHRAA